MSKTDILDIKFLSIKRLAAAVIEKYGKEPKTKKEALDKIRKISLPSANRPDSRLAYSPRMIEIVNYPREILYIFKRFQAIIPYQLISISCSQEVSFSDSISISLLAVYSQMLLSREWSKRLRESIERSSAPSKCDFLAYLSTLNLDTLGSAQIVKALQGDLPTFVQKFHKFLNEVIKNSDLNSKYQLISAAPPEAKTEFIESFIRFTELTFIAMSLFSNIILVKVDGSRNLNMKHIIINSQKKTSLESTVIVLESPTRVDIYICPPEVVILKADTSTDKTQLLQQEISKSPQATAGEDASGTDSHLSPNLKCNSSTSHASLNSSNSKKPLPLIFSREKNFIRAASDTSAGIAQTPGGKKEGESKVQKAEQPVPTTLKPPFLAQGQSPSKKLTPEKTTNLSSEKEHISVSKIPFTDGMSGKSRIVLRSGNPRADLPSSSPVKEKLAQPQATKRDLKPPSSSEHAANNLPNVRTNTVELSNPTPTKKVFFTREKGVFQTLNRVLHHFNINAQKNLFFFRGTAQNLTPGKSRSDINQPPKAQGQNSGRYIYTGLNSSLPQTSRAPSITPQTANVPMSNAMSPSKLPGYTPFSAPLSPGFTAVGFAPANFPSAPLSTYTPYKEAPIPVPGSFQVFHSHRPQAPIFVHRPPSVDSKNAIPRYNR